MKAQMAYLKNNSDANSKKVDMGPFVKRDEYLWTPTKSYYFLTIALFMIMRKRYQ